MLIHRLIAASSAFAGLALLFGAVLLDVVKDRHTLALVIGGLGAVLTIVATLYHMILLPARGHRPWDRSSQQQ